MIKVTSQGGKPIFVLVGAIMWFRRLGLDGTTTRLAFVDGSYTDVTETPDEIANAIAVARSAWK